MLKPALARGELHIVGATTIDEYRKNIEKDAALERRFQPILVPEPTVSRHDRDPARAARPLRGAPPGPVHRRGAGRGRGAVRPLHHRPVPAGQGDRPDRPGGRPGAAAHQDARPGTAASASSGSSSCAGRRTRRWPSRTTSGPARCATRSPVAQPTAPGRRGAPRRPSRAVPEVDRRRHRRGRLPGDRHPGRAAHRRRRRTGCSRLEQHLHQRVIGQDDAVRRSPRRSAARGPGSATRTGPSAASCSSGRPASARPSWPGRWPRLCSAARTG